jgi:2-isopropylmalate synthase
VGNRAHVLVSELPGAARAVKAAEMGLDLDGDVATQVLEEIKAAEHRGYAFEAADASFELLVRRVAGRMPSWFDLDGYRVVIEKSGGLQVGGSSPLDGRAGGSGGSSPQDNTDRSEAIVRLVLGEQRVVAVGEGVGPVHALDQALRKALSELYPELASIHLVDYKVRILDGRAATSAVTRVMLTSADHEGEWTTVGVSDDIVTASWEALADGISYGLLRAGAQALVPAGVRG